MALGKRIKNINQDNHFFYLTIALSLLLLSTALTEMVDSRWVDSVLTILTVVIFLVCLASLRFDSRWQRTLIAVLCIWIIMTLVRILLSINSLDIASLLLTLAFFLGTFVSIARQILLPVRVNTNTMIGSVALFLLLGLMWAILYLIILELTPHSFSGIPVQSWSDNFSNMTYFSFVTLTTLGYGDIAPVTPIAQVVVYLEAIAGVFYMAIVVSSLVSANIATQKSKH